ncbi:hypothetical protein ACS0TY_011915 [Phlomoides rotata]
MIIKGVFRRYERWNPVRPTIGAFWGVGIGIGCGIGWGPGYGHEVVGNVGAGCGAGFNVGFTLLGIGIGFPANYLFNIPRSAFMATKRGALDESLPGNKSIAADGWGADGSYLSEVQHTPRSLFSGFNIDCLTENIRDMPDVKSMLHSNVKHMTDCLLRVGGGLFPQDREVILVVSGASFSLQLSSVHNILASINFEAQLHLFVLRVD